MAAISQADAVRFLLGEEVGRRAARDARTAELNRTPDAGADRWCRIRRRRALGRRLSDLVGGRRTRLPPWLADWTATASGAPCCCVLPAADHPSRSSLDRLTHEYELKDQLDGAWAVRPLDLVRDAGRTMLVLEDADGEPLDRLLGAPMEVGRFLRPRHRYCGGCRQASPARPRPQGHQAGQYPGQRRDRRGAADRVRHRLTLGARAPVASPSRDDRRHARLHGARADRTDESVDRFPQRPLRPRRHLLPNAHRCFAVYGRRRRWNGCTATSPGGRWHPPSG